MMNVDYKDDHENPVSFPADHKKDVPPAPDDLFAAMEDVDFGLAKRELHARFAGDSKPLELALRVWLKHLAADHKQVVYRVDKSGGWGADAVGGGGTDKDNDDEEEEEEQDEEDVTERKSAVHFYHFCAGKLPPMLWRDVMSTKGGGRVSHYGDMVIPDGADGMGSSVPGGPRVSGVEGPKELGEVDRERNERRRASKVAAIDHAKNEKVKTTAIIDLVTMFKEDRKIDATTESEQESVTVENIPAIISKAPKEVLALEEDVARLPETACPLAVAGAKLALTLSKGKLEAIMKKYSPSM